MRVKNLNLALALTAALVLIVGGLTGAHFVEYVFNGHLLPDYDENDPPPNFAVLKDAYKNIPASDRPEIRFAVYGDVEGGNTVAEDIVKEVEADGKYDFAICAGDEVHHHTADEFVEFDEGALRYWKKTPLLFVPGNHDTASNDQARTEFALNYGASHYSFTIGKNLFLVFDNASNDVFNEEFNWLKDQLEKADGVRYSSIRAFMHRPPVNMGILSIFGSHQLSAEKGDKLMGLLARHHVTAVLCAHYHGYGYWHDDGIPVWATGGGGGLLAPGQHLHYLEVIVRNGKVSVIMHRLRRGVIAEALQIVMYLILACGVLVAALALFGKPVIRLLKADSAGFARKALLAFAPTALAGIILWRYALGETLAVYALVMLACLPLTALILKIAGISRRRES